MSDWHCFATSAELDTALAAHIARRLEADLHQRGCASLALSGGTTPIGMLRQLASQPLDWSRVWVTLVDERCVATDSPASNERMLRAELLQQEAAAARFLGLAGACNGDLGALGEQLRALPRPFSAVALGMGADGHTASWFPQATNLAALLDPAGPATVAATDPVTAPHQRITLTLPTVLDSREILLHITGAEKRDVLQDALAKDYPVAAILRQESTPATIWWTPK
ncbi:MAG: 6-phosphogluconolactonase [Pseudomonadales bacterium]|nr:6-phosphogluconolactonase [Halieaceae bacterium]MCP5164585.1 6-phosphogluconolactonase [Pseudomonadales bacterium]MCP5189731.1 6-phosphogluconolactonase [Pseudomonadales bacterium]MCP5204276.1 6-phosphogluconolactonase [Pseudomonadales bacterium]